MPTTAHSVNILFCFLTTSVWSPAHKNITTRIMTIIFAGPATNLVLPALTTLRTPALHVRQPVSFIRNDASHNSAQLDRWRILLFRAVCLANPTARSVKQKKWINVCNANPISIGTIGTVMLNVCQGCMATNSLVSYYVTSAIPAVWPATTTATKTVWRASMASSLRKTTHVNFYVQERPLLTRLQENAWVVFKTVISVVTRHLACSACLSLCFIWDSAFRNVQTLFLTCTTCKNARNVTLPASLASKQESALA